MGFFFFFHHQEQYCMHCKTNILMLQKDFHHPEKPGSQYQTFKDITSLPVLSKLMWTILHLKRTTPFVHRCEFHYVCSGCVVFLRTHYSTAGSKLPRTTASDLARPEKPISITLLCPANHCLCLFLFDVIFQIFGLMEKN